METKQERTIAEWKRVRDRWAAEHAVRVMETNRANFNERSALRRFQEAEKNYQKALNRKGK